MNYPTRQGCSHPVNATTGIVSDRGFGRIIREVAVNEADEHTAQSDDDQRCHQTPHVFSNIAQLICITVRYLHHSIQVSGSLASCDDAARLR